MRASVYENFYTPHRWWQIINTNGIDWKTTGRKKNRFSRYDENARLVLVTGENVINRLERFHGKYRIRDVVGSTAARAGDRQIVSTGRRVVVAERDLFSRNRFSFRYRRWIILYMTRVCVRHMDHVMFVCPSLGRPTTLPQGRVD